MLSELAGNVLFRISLGDFEHVHAESLVQGASPQEVCDAVAELTSAFFAIHDAEGWKATARGVSALFAVDEFEYEPYDDEEALANKRVLAESREEFKRRPVWATGREGVFNALLVGGFIPREAWSAACSVNGFHDADANNEGGNAWEGFTVEVSRARDLAFASRYSRRFAGRPRAEWDAIAEGIPDDEVAAATRLKLASLVIRQEGVES